MTIGLNYYHVIKGNWFLSSGLFFGVLGRIRIQNDIKLLENNFQVESPYASANNPITYKSIQYSLLDYTTSAAGIGLNIGLGYFHEFSVKHGFRGNLNYKMGMSNTLLLGTYHSLEKRDDIHVSTTIHHSFHAVSLELYHTIRLNGRMTFFYGVKAPYYFNYGNKNFTPKSTHELLNGIEADFSLGFTRVVGKCD